jgi:hypothetical protein|tara:strand:+ start:3739 stop:4149 length:411 start_codon:yes stop_codon:yes gene_type:complete
MNVHYKSLQQLIREELAIELLAEQSAEGDALSNAELTKQLKTGAAAIAGAVPAKLNDELARILQTLTAMAQYDKAKFDKMVGYADQLGANALEKAQKGEKSPEEGAAATKEGLARQRIQQIIREEITKHVRRNKKY